MYDEKIVKEFWGKYRFLSNFFILREGGKIVPITIEGKEYVSNEHYFQSMKATDPEKQELIRIAPTPGEAKKLGRKFKMRTDWENVKQGVMEKGLNAKFRNPKLREKLLETGDMLLQEGNKWNDKYWGVDIKTGQGKNHLGKLLMKLRKEIRES